MTTFNDLPVIVYEIIISYQHMMFVNKLLSSLAFDNFSPTIFIDPGRTSKLYNKFKNINKICVTNVRAKFNLSRIIFNHLVINNSMTPLNINSLKNLKTLKLHDLPESVKIQTICDTSSLEELHVSNRVFNVHNLPSLKKCWMWYDDTYDYMRNEKYDLQIYNLPNIISFRFWVKKNIKKFCRDEYDSRFITNSSFNIHDINKNIEELVCEELNGSDCDYYIMNLQDTPMCLKHARFAISSRRLDEITPKIEKYCLESDSESESDSNDPDSEILKIIWNNYNWKFKPGIFPGSAHVYF
jgi:hypothetical protein